MSAPPVASWPRIALVVLALLAAPARADVRLLFPLGRTAYQTNESIDLAVIRTGRDARPVPLRLALYGKDGSKIECTFPARPAAGDRATDHLRLNARLFRPGTYTVAVSVDGPTPGMADGAAGAATVEIFSHLRRSSFKLIDWASRAKGPEQALLGERSMGFNLNFAAYGGIDADAMVRGGLDYMRNCTMGGAHQMDLRQECDWSDPYVLQGGEARAVRQALADRLNGNCLGVHYYDEPGLTWWKHKDTGVSVPYNLPSQDRSYAALTGQAPPQYHQVKPDDPEAVAKWKAMNRWKLSVIDAAWKYSQFGVRHVDPRLLSATQSVYGFPAYADGYYFNVARSLPVLSGHGGYSDWGPGYWNPSWTFEMGRMRDYQKPNWYLATWAGKMPADQYRLETWLCFMMNLQGIAKPPDARIHTPQAMGLDAAQGIVEVNRLAERLGTVFTTMPVDRGEVAMLWSISHILDAQVRDMQTADGINKSAYEGGGARDKSILAYEAGKRIGVNLFPIVEEDILDGSAGTFRMIFLPGVDFLEPNVIAALEAYIAAGGHVVVSDESKVRIKGAEKLGCAMTVEAAEKVRQLHREKRQKEANELETTDYYWQAAKPVADALWARYNAAHLERPAGATADGVIISRQRHGDVAYTFFVNATWDERGGRRNSIKPVQADVWLTTRDGTVYDAARGGPAAEFERDGIVLEATLRFGPGQMRAFAQTRRPIGGVQVSPPLVRRDLVGRDGSIAAEISGFVVDDKNTVVAGSIPLQVRVTDPLGAVRFDGFRATDRGVLRIDVPLAANDPAGDWNVEVTELLAGKSGTAAFKYQPVAANGAVAGAIPRAVSFANDRENAFRFFRLYRDLTIVTGKSDFNAPAAQRLVEALKPWDVRCTVVPAADAAKPRLLTDDERPTWVGLDAGRLTPTPKNPEMPRPNPGHVGFSVRGPVILLGNPDDNPILKFALDKNFLPAKPHKTDYPGPGRGLLAWQRDLVSYQSESIALVAYDEAGMQEAVGTLYEAAAALDPLMALTPPAPAVVTPAAKATDNWPEGRIAWRTVLPDRARSMALLEHGTQVRAITADASDLAIETATGRIVSRNPVPESAPGAEAPPAPGARPPAAQPPVAQAPTWTPPKLPPDLAGAVLPYRVVKAVLAGGDQTAIIYWGGTVQVVDASGKIACIRLLPGDVLQQAWAGPTLILSLSDTTIVALATK